MVSEVSEVKAASRLMVDAPVRMFHALFAVCFFGAWLTSESEAWRSLHVTLGYSMIVLLLFRIAYGLFGPQQARLSKLFGRMKGAFGMMSLFGRGGQGEGVGKPQLLGMIQNSSMAAAILVLIVLALLTCLSGYLAWNNAPEWVAELHEEIGEALINFCVIHIALVLLFSLIRRRNLALSMLSGKIAGPGPSIVQHNRLWLALSLLAAVSAFAAYDLQQRPAEALSDHERTQLSQNKYEDAGRGDRRKHEKGHAMSR